MLRRCPLPGDGEAFSAARAAGTIPAPLKNVKFRAGRVTPGVAPSSCFKTVPWRSAPHPARVRKEPGPKERNLRIDPSGHTHSRDPRGPRWRKHAREDGLSGSIGSAGRERRVDAGRPGRLVCDRAGSGGNRTLQSAFRAGYRGRLSDGRLRGRTGGILAEACCAADGSAKPVPDAARPDSRRRAADRRASRIGRLADRPAVHLVPGGRLPRRRCLASRDIQGGTESW